MARANRAMGAMHGRTEPMKLEIEMGDVKAG